MSRVVALLLSLLMIPPLSAQIVVSGGANRSIVVAGQRRPAVAQRPVKPAVNIPVTLPAPVLQESRYLISERWCGLCPAARRRFLAAGNPTANIISMAEAKRRFGVSRNPPFEFTVREQPSKSVSTAYRSQWPPKWSLNGTRNYSRGYILSHLRNNLNHRGKFWQSWDLESWTREQLAALHDDDHEGRVVRP